MESALLLPVVQHLDFALGITQLVPEDFKEQIKNFLLTYTDTVVQLPYLALWVIGILWAIVFKKRDPERGRMVLFAFVLLFISALIGLILREILPEQFQKQSWSSTRLTFLYVLIVAIPIVGHLVSWTVLFKTLLPPKDIGNG